MDEQSESAQRDSSDPARSSKRSRGGSTPPEGSEHPGKRLVESLEWLAIATEMKLTQRELEVVKLLFTGHNRDSVSSMLSIKPRTVRQYIEQIHLKLGVDNRVDLVLVVVEHRDRLRSGTRPN